MEIKQLLENLANSEDLRHLEVLLKTEFNIFEALGTVRQELRHSNLLAFLLDPHQSHGLEDRFLKHFLKLIHPEGSTLLKGQSLDSLDLKDCLVNRELYHIDILISNERLKLAWVIENKIDSGEHSDQLARYRKVITGVFPDYQSYFVFLTPDGLKPSDPSYVPLSYEQVVQVLTDIHQAHNSTLAPDVNVLLTHYVKMLRRHIMSNSEIIALCHKIYREHWQALDFIWDNLPDSEFELADFLKQLIIQTKTYGLVIEYDDMQYISFYPEDWTDTPPLLFEFENILESLILNLYISSDASSRQKESLYNFALDHPEVFVGIGTKKTAYPRIYKRTFLTPKDYKDVDLEALQAKVQTHWDKFLENDLPAIQKVLQKYTPPVGRRQKRGGRS